MEDKIWLDDKKIHEIKSPLSAILGSTELFVEGLLGPLTDEQKKYMLNIKVSAEKIMNTIKALQEQPPKKSV